VGARRSRGRGAARGVLHGIRASVEHAFGSPDLSGRTVLVQGVGSVGHDLARYLRDDGAHVLVADVAEGQAQRVATDTGAELVAAADAIQAECDVYSPCAVGGTRTPCYRTTQPGASSVEDIQNFYNGVMIVHHGDGLPGGKCAAIGTLHRTAQKVPHFKLACAELDAGVLIEKP